MFRATKGEKHRIFFAAIQKKELNKSQFLLIVTITLFSSVSIEELKLYFLAI